MKLFVDFAAFYKNQLDIKNNRTKDLTTSILASDFNLLDGDSFNSNSPIAYLLLKKQLALKQKNNSNHRFTGIVKNEPLPKSMTMGRASRIFDNIAKHKSLKCEYCHKDLKVSEVTFDHFIPQAAGGKDSKGNNLFVSCQVCNVLKGAINPYKHSNLFLVYLKAVRQDKQFNSRYLIEELIKNCTKEEFIFLVTDKKQSWQFDEWMLVFNYIVTNFTEKELKKVMYSNSLFRYTINRGKRILRNPNNPNFKTTPSTYFYFSCNSFESIKSRIENNKMRSKNVKNKIFSSRYDIERLFQIRINQLERELFLHENKMQKLSRDKVRYLKNEIMIYKEQLKIVEYKVKQ